MILNWKKDRVKIIPTNTGVTKMLLPGINEISEKEWEFAKASLQIELKLGLLEEVKMTTQPAPGRPAKTATSVIELDPKKAKSLIKETSNGDTLNGWLAKENRSDVRRYIEDRLTELGIDKKEVEFDDESDSKKVKDSKPNTEDEK